jgi:arginyl-tRNA synthetase
MRETLEKEIQDVLIKLGVAEPQVNFDYPARMVFGDLSTNVAMMYAKQLDRKPIDLANEIKEGVSSKNISHVVKVEVAPPGFINFFFDTEYFAKAVKENEPSKIFEGQKIIIEHTQPNPFKEFHIGHLMNNAIGEAISRIIKANGAEIKTYSYHGDVGLHVAKAIWSLLKNPGNLNAYAEGNTAYEENENAKNEIIEINKKIYDKSDSQINSLYEEGRKNSLEHFEKIYQKLRSNFDYHFYESESGEIGKKIVEENIGKVFEKGDEGAIIFKGENFEPKTHTRVFLNKGGLPTYEAKELGLAKIKKDVWGYDRSITITANEQDSFFKVVEVAIGKVFPELENKLTHISHGMLRLPEGKMSSRTGNIISAESLIEKVKEKVLKKMNSRILPEQSEGSITYKAIATTAQKNETAEIVAIAAIKFSILRQAIGGDIIFDFEKSISFEGDSGPYLQYAAVRAKTLLEKAKGQIESSSKIPEGWQTTNLERLLTRYSDVLEKAGREYAPHHVVTYLVELAGEFNAFYASHKIIDTADSTSPYRIALTEVFARIMAQGLNCLGIKIPEHM